MDLEDWVYFNENAWLMILTLPCFVVNHESACFASLEDIYGRLFVGIVHYLRQGKGRMYGKYLMLGYYFF